MARCAMAAMVVVLCTTVAVGDTLYVNHAAAPGGDGLSWATAYDDLQSALNDSYVDSNVDEIWVAEGVYLPTYEQIQGDPLSRTFPVGTEIAIVGGFAGWESSRDERDLTLHETVLSGDLNQNDIANWQNRGDNVWRVLTNSESLSTFELDGLTITSGGSGVYSDNATSGGGLYAQSAGILRNCIFRECQTRRYYLGGNEGGGAIYYRVDAGDGGILIENCRFETNRVIGNPGNNGNPGGAIYLDAEHGTASWPVHVIRDSWFENNQTNEGASGGAVFSESRTRVIGCTFIGNKAIGGTGGALWLSCWWDGTWAYSVVSHCRFHGNEATWGGAIYNPANMWVLNCIGTGNWAAEGGGFAVGVCPSNHYFSWTLGFLHVRNCTLTANGAGTTGGAIFMPCGQFNFEGGCGTILNSIVRGNNSPWGADIRNDWGGTCTGYVYYDWSNVGDAALEGNASAGANNMNLDPMFDDVDGLDGILGTLDDDLHLATGSPCIDACSSSYVEADYGDIDQDGDYNELGPLDLDYSSRVVDVPSVENTGGGDEPYVDLGAYEIPGCYDCPGERTWLAWEGGDFHLNANWYPLRPGPYNEAVFELDADYTVNFSDHARTKSLIVRDGEATMSLDGMTWELMDDFSPSLMVAESPGQSAVLHVGGGLLTGQSGVIGFEVDTVGQMTVAGAETNVSFLQSLSVGFGGVGHLTVSDGAQLLARDLSIGELTSGDGTLTITGNDSLVTVPFFMLLNHGRVAVHEGATLRVSLLGMAMFEDATLTGNGTVESDVYNFGTLDPGVAAGRGGTLTIVGNFDQVANVPGLGTTAGTLRIDAGLDGNDALHVSGTASLSGGLRVVADDTWNPASGTEFPFLQANNIDGRFDVAFMPGLGDDRFAKLVYPGEARGAGSVVNVQIDDFENVMGFGDTDTVDLTDLPSDIVVTDLNGDTFADIALAMPDTGGGSILVLFSDGAGGFGSSQQITVGANPVSIAAGDVDGDGSIDLATANADGGGVSIVYGTGGTFGAATDIATGAKPSCVVMVDVDDDGGAEVLVSDEADGTLTVLSDLNILGGGALVIPLDDDPIFIDPSREEDQKDILRIGFVTKTAQTIGMVIRDSDGVWTVLPTVPAGTTPSGLTAADLDQDGLVDLIVTGENGIVSIVLTDADGMLSPAVVLPAATTTRAPIAVDFDLDGDMDLLLLAGDESGVVTGLLLRNDSNLTDFEQLLIADGQTLDLGGNPVALGAGDLDGDGLDDVVAINGVQTLRGTGPQLLAINNDSTPPAAQPCPGDADNTGTVDIEDLLVMLGQWGVCPDCSADFDGNGTVDIEDLLIMLGGWGPCDDTP